MAGLRHLYRCLLHPARKLICSCHLPIRHEGKAFTEFILGDFFIGLDTHSADSNSYAKSVSYLNLIPTLTPTLVWCNFFHLEDSLC